VGSTFVHQLLDATGAKPPETVRAYLLNREIFGFVDLWKAIETLDNVVPDAVQSAMLIDTSRLIIRGTTWFLRSRRLSDDMAATIGTSPRKSRPSQSGCCGCWIQASGRASKRVSPNTLPKASPPNWLRGR